MPRLKLGDPAPPFTLPGVDGSEHSLDDFDDMPVAVVFSCVHCPYVIAYEPRIVALAKEYGPKRIDFVAVNANDATRYPDDGMQPMKVRSRERGFSFPYLRDD